MKHLFLLSLVIGSLSTFASDKIKSMSLDCKTSHEFGEERANSVKFNLKIEQGKTSDSVELSLGEDIDVRLKVDLSFSSIVQNVNGKLESIEVGLVKTSQYYLDGNGSKIDLGDLESTSVVDPLSRVMNVQKYFIDADDYAYQIEVSCQVSSTL